MIKRPPFKVEEEGWGEFDLGVTLHYVEREGSKELTHDLNFQEAKYESPHKLVPTPKTHSLTSVDLQKSLSSVSQDPRGVGTRSWVRGQKAQVRLGGFGLAQETRLDVGIFGEAS